MKEIYEKYLGEVLGKPSKEQYDKDVKSKKEKYGKAKKGKYYTGNFKPVTQMFERIYGEFYGIIKIAQNKYIETDMKKLQKQLDVIADNIDKDNS